MNKIWSTLQKTYANPYILCPLCVVVAVITGFWTGDNYLGISVIASAFLNGYLASQGYVQSYFFGIVYCLLNAIISFQAHYYGIAIFCLAFFIPIQIWGWINWRQKIKGVEEQVAGRKFTWQNTLIVTAICMIGSFILGGLFSLIPGQKFATLNAASNIINLCATLLLALRFREAWILWIINSLTDILLWGLGLSGTADNSASMIIVMSGYLIINIFGVINWSKTKHVQKMNFKEVFSNKN